MVMAHSSTCDRLAQRAGFAGGQSFRRSGVPGGTGLMTCHQHPRAGEVPVPGGRMTRGMVRRGDRLLRPMGPWSPAVHEYLRHLEAAWFAGSPRVLGTEGNREVLTFIDGDVAADPHWQPGHGHRVLPYARTGLALRGVAQLIRNLHSAAAGFRPAITSYRFGPRPPQPGEVVSHGDLGPWNTVEADPRSRRHTHDRMAAVGGQGNARHGSGPAGKTPRRKGCATRPAKSATHCAPQDGGQSCASRTSRSPARALPPGRDP